MRVISLSTNKKKIGTYRIVDYNKDFFIDYHKYELVLNIYKEWNHIYTLDTIAERKDFIVT